MDPKHWRGVIAPEVKDLFGRPLRVLLATWIIHNKMAPVYLLEAQIAMQPFGEASSGVATELRVFVAKGMLTEFADGRRIYFTPTGSVLWEAYRAIGQAYSIWGAPLQDGHVSAQAVDAGR